MAGSYDTEDSQNERYRLSFTVGGLLAEQGRIIAALFSGDRGEHVNPDSDPVNRTTEVEHEIGERITRIRKQAIEENVFSIRTRSANSRVVSEVLKRLSALTETEIHYLADDDTPASDRQALMWVAMCRYYALVGEFANEVLRERYLMGFSTLTKDDYDRFIQAKSMWHPELEELSALTAGKLRSNVFKAMSEAELWEKESDTLLPSLLSKSVTAIFDNRPESFRFFPTRER
ncbi:MAG: DUF1819 family protein [Bifidobacterium breve]|jgi:hypothetical protein|uniref:DUF1819 family protein n=1 Tax=Bifidobacterium breve TaxID=1685 RepID=UPI0022AF412E|nr:DUF1819 family protein [Bifidobacterium breve]MCI2117724.1 DUF1819 family protein [Bifidobacterium breve]MCI2130967.1 DUF1819 family protein [Bifidobacterium breve]MCZ4418762.1 DUF1819 family protein [Bifidobacterium breve]MCZ4422533.1 DUF1819 family protein [Bifidobacterium breve]MCZ4465594.1 DUF1819 family protein [Bifidobacterium breve]